MKKLELSNNSANLLESLNKYLAKSPIRRGYSIEGCVASLDDIRSVLKLSKAPPVYYLDSFEVVALRRRTKIYKTYDITKYVYILLEGVVNVLSPDYDGVDSLVLDVLFRGDLVGLEALGADRCTTTAVAISDVILIRIPKRIFIGWHEVDEQFYIEIASLYSRKLHQVMRLKLMMSKCTTERRVALFIVDLAQRLYSKSDLGFNQMAFPRIQVAAHIGMSAETLCREISKLKKLNLVRYEKQRLQILDFYKLKILSGHDEARIRFESSMHPYEKAAMRH